MRFYGGSPMLWLNEVPLCVVNAHVAMLGPIEAEESRAAVNIAAVGRAVKVDARRQLSSWDAAMRPNGERPSGVPPGAGIKVKVIPRA